MEIKYHWRIRLGHTFDCGYKYFDHRPTQSDMNRRDIIDWLFAYGYDLDTYSLAEIKSLVRRIQAARLTPPRYGSAYWPALQTFLDWSFITA